MPFFLLLLAGAVGGLIAWACDADSASEPNTGGDSLNQPQQNKNFGHSNGGHSGGGYFTHHHEGFRQGHHRRRGDGSYIY